MKPPRLFFATLLTALFLFLTTNVFALTFMGTDNTGARYYKCGFSCGKFKVIRKAKNIYRIFSIHFSGEVKANSFKEAAAFGCEKSDGPLRKLVDPMPSRHDSSC
jgi:hypothetical protein